MDELIVCESCSTGFDPCGDQPPRMYSMTVCESCHDNWYNGEPSNESMASVIKGAEFQARKHRMEISNLKAQVAEKDSLYRTAIKQLTEKGHEVADLKAQVEELKHGFGRVVTLLSSREHINVDVACFVAKQYVEDGTCFDTGWELEHGMIEAKAEVEAKDGE